MEDILRKLNELEKLGGLRFMTLHVLDDGPKTGSEVMISIQNHREQINEILKLQELDYVMDDNDEIKDSFKPSPGSIYPLLKKLIEESLVIKREDGKYELTVFGQQTIFRISGNLKHSINEPVERGEMAIETALNEIDSYISFLENIKTEKFVSKLNRIDVFIERLKKLRES